MKPGAEVTAGTGDAGVATVASVGRRPIYRQLRPGPGKGRDEVVANQRSRLVAATIELVSERGYEGMTVGKIVQLAGVSKASFYGQFSGKDECFIAACDTALRAAASAVLRGESSAGGGRDRLRAGFTSLAELIAVQPKGAKLILIDSLASTPAIREHVCQRFGLLEALVHERLAPAGQAKLPRALTAGIVRGIEHHARRCVAAGCPERLRDLVDPLLDWGLGFVCEMARRTFAAPAAPVSATSPTEATGTRALLNTRDLLTAATLRLASRESCTALTPSRIRRAAGVSRRSFDENFPDATSCFLAAVEAELERRFGEAQRAVRGVEDWGVRTSMVLDRFASSLAGAPDLARLAFVESLDAAPESLLWREKLVANWAEALYSGAPIGSRPSPPIAEATVAAIWGHLADLAAADRLHLLPGQTRRLVYFALAPGGRGAIEAAGRAQNGSDLSGACSFGKAGRVMNAFS